MKKAGSIVGCTFVQAVRSSGLMFLTLLLVALTSVPSFASSYNFSQTFDGVTVSGTFNVVNDTFWNTTPGYTANSTSTVPSMLSDLSLSFSFSGAALFNPGDYTLNSWNIFLATPSGATSYLVGDDTFPNGYEEGFYAEFSSTADGSMMQVLARLGYDMFWDPTRGPVTDYDHPWYGKINYGTGTVTTQNLMVVTSSGAVPAPEPATMLLLGLGLMGLAGVRRRSRKG
ncbi:MAG: PEP-CTERM sorting domain-containing protein [Deltaproteobacteria bacterium]|nr:PEP-CTERM sorting domain-containing protein [Deltaproteobacteria bacterium]